MPAGRDSVLIIAHDRYTATGIPRPNHRTVCKGRCEGMGCVPVTAHHPQKRFRDLWKAAERKHGPSEDGYHFVICPDCNGTGKR